MQCQPTSKTILSTMRRARFSVAVAAILIGTGGVTGAAAATTPANPSGESAVVATSASPSTMQLRCFPVVWCNR